MREIERPLSPETIGHYGKGVYSARNQLFAQMLRRHADGGRPLRIFEFAGSGGFLAREILNVVPNIEVYHHSDGNQLMVEHARQIVPRDRAGRVIIEKIDMVRDLHEINWADYNCFITPSIEHLPNDKEVIAAMPEGALVLMCTPTYGGKWHHFHTADFGELMARYTHLVHFLEFQELDKPNPGILRRAYQNLLAMTGLPLADDLIKPDRKLIFIGRRRSQKI